MRRSNSTTASYSFTAFLASRILRTYIGFTCVESLLANLGAAHEAAHRQREGIAFDLVTARFELAADVACGPGGVECHKADFEARIYGKKR